MQPSAVNKGRLSALRHRQFLVYWLGSFASVGATQLQVMGLGWLVWELTSNALTLGYLGMAAGLPAIIMTLFGGVLADRFDRRKLLMLTSILTALLLAALAYLDFSGIVVAWHVIAIAAAISLITGIDWPARQAIFPALIEREDMMSAVALTTIIWQTTRMVMPAFGGLIIAYADTWVLFAFCSLGFFSMFFIMLSIKIKVSITESSLSVIRQLTEGIEFILHDRTFLMLISLSYAIFFFASSHMQLMPAFADRLGVDAQGFGYLLSITGIGAVMGTIFSSPLQKSRMLGVSMLGSSFIYCVMIYGFALTTYWLFDGAYLVALAIIFIASAFSSIFMITSTTVLQLEVPDQLRGRVMGFHAITYNMLPLGGMLAGTIAAKTNPPLAICIGTSIFLVYLIWVIVTQPGIRGLDGEQLTQKISPADADQISSELETLNGQ